MKLIPVIFVLLLSGCGSMYGNYISNSKEMWFQDNAVWGLVYCKSNDQGENKDAQPICYRAKLSNEELKTRNTAKELDPKKCIRKKNFKDGTEFLDCSL